MTRLGGWKVRGVEPRPEADPTIDELQVRVDELEAECDWQNAWNTELLNIALRHARDSEAIRNEVEEKRRKARESAVRTVQEHKQAREAWGRELWPKVLAEANGDKAEAHRILWQLMIKWSAESGIKPWSLRTIRDRF